MKIFYTDGSAGANNMVAGGWALIEINGQDVIHKAYGTDFSKDVTNNKMELRAAIEAAKLVGKNEVATIHSDSQYVVKGISEWVKGWQKNGWKTSKKEDVLNKDLWLEFLEATKENNIKWVWVRGHSTDRFNHIVDKLSKLCYLDPSKIESSVTITERKSQLIIQPNVGDVIYFEDNSKKYAVILNDVRIDGKLGFFARLLSNAHGNELDFFSYEGARVNKVSEQSIKEKQIVFKTINAFSDNVKNKAQEFQEKCNHDMKKHGGYFICSICEKKEEY